MKNYKNHIALCLMALVFGFTQLSAQEYGNTLNTFVKFGSNSSIAANYEIQVAKDITLAPTARIWFSGKNTFALGGRGDFYFDRLFGLSAPWDIWAGADAGFVVSGDSNKDDFSLNLHAGVEYKFSGMFGVIFEFGGGSTSSGGIGLAFHFQRQVTKHVPNFRAAEIDESLDLALRLVVKRVVTTYA